MDAPYIIYSANEAALQSGAGFWSNADGWVDDAESATRFCAHERISLPLPLSAGQDAQWCLAKDFLR